MVYNNSKAKLEARVVTLDEVAETLAKQPSPGEKPEVFRWRGHEDVFLLRFPSNSLQKASMARLSIFLEDAQFKDTVVSALPAGRVGGAAAYTGHNMRADDVARFYALAGHTGVKLDSAETQLRALLEDYGVLVSTAAGLGGAAGASVLAVARGFEPAEARETLLHEAMHGLFYCSGPFAAACWAFWREQLLEEQRGTFRAFLATLGYDSSNEELVLNEFQAYMATERKLFGGVGAGCASGAGRRKGAGAGAGGRGGDDAGASGPALLAMQQAFNQYIAPHVPLPHPQLTNCSCLFAGVEGGGGIFKLPGAKTKR